MVKKYHLIIYQLDNCSYNVKLGIKSLTKYFSPEKRLTLFLCLGRLTLNFSFIFVIRVRVRSITFIFTINCDFI